MERADNIEKCDLTMDMASQVIDMDVVEPLVQQIYQDRVLGDPSTDFSLDTGFFTNEAVDFGHYDQRIGYGQVLQFSFREDVKPLDNVEVSNISYKEDITCGGQLDLDCSIPCGGTTPTFRTDEFRLSKQYAAMAQHCRKTQKFMTNVDFMTEFNRSVEAARFVFALDVWNKFVCDALESTQATVDPRIAKNPKLATHVWDATDQPEENYISILTQAYRYMTANWKGNFSTIVPEEVAHAIDRTMAASALYNSTGMVLSGLTLGEIFNGFMTPKSLPAPLLNVNLQVMMNHQNFTKGAVDLFPLYGTGGEPAADEMYVIVASRDAFVYHTITDDEVYTDKGGCNSPDGAVDKMTKLFYAGFKTIYPEKVLVIKLRRPEFEFAGFNFCCA